jgi:hypothetical protein
MTIRECGVPDDPLNPPTLNFTNNGVRWNKTSLTYRFGSFTPDISQIDVRTAIRTAFDLWSNVTPLIFTEINTGTPDILLNFVASIPGSTAARATWNSVGGIITDSQIIFDDSDIWALAVPIAAASLDLVDFAAHEIGHALGLGHSLIQTAIMRSAFNSGTTQRSLDQDDINGIQSIYGSINRGEFYTTDGGGNISPLKNHRGWRKTWQLIIPGNFGGDGTTDLLFYDPTIGEGEFYIADGGGNISLLKNHGGWRKTWQLIIPGNFGGGGTTDLLFYDPTV